MEQSPRPRVYRESSVDPAGEFTLDVPEQVFHLAHQITRHREARLDTVLAPYRLTVAHWRMLTAIRRIENCSMSDLARFSTIDRTTLTRAVDHLVAEGLVDRHVPPNDRRLVILSLTEAGEAVYEPLIAQVMAINRELVSVVPARRRRELTRALEAVLTGLIQDPAAAEDIISFAKARKRR